MMLRLSLSGSSHRPANRAMAGHLVGYLLLSTVSLPVVFPGIIASEALFSGTAHATTSTDFVGQFGSKLEQILNSPTPLEQKRKQILPLLEENVDIPAIGRYCLGRYWSKATPAQQKRYIELFTRVVLFSVTQQIGNYQNLSLKITGHIPDPDGKSEKVSLLISRPQQPDINMTVVTSTSSPPKVIDLYGEGASMRLTQRGDYTAYLQRHGNNIEALLDAMQRQVNMNSQTH